MRLPRLSRADTAALCAAIRADVPPRELTEAVHDRSDGVPLHVEELLGGDSAGAVPESLADAILDRAGTLGPAARELASAAAVIGRSFGLDLLTAVVGEPATVIDDALGELVDRFFVRPGAGDDRYDFRHALIRDALYAALAPLRRRELHARVAAAAAAAGFGDAYVSDQYERARQPGPAYAHAVAAAQAAAALSAHREAVELYRRAQRNTPSDTGAAERADLLAGVGAALAATDDPAGAAIAYADAVALHRERGDAAKAAVLVPALVAARHLLGAPLAERVGLLAAALADAADPAPVRAALAAAYMLDRRLDEAIAHGEAARATADPVTRVNCEASVGAALVFAGRMDEGWDRLRAAVHGALEANAEAEAARGYRMIGSSASVLVEYPLAERWLVEGIAYAERTERFNDRHYIAAHLAHVRWAIGDWAAADTIARQALADGDGSLTTRITGWYVLGYLALGHGDWATATERLTAAYQAGAHMRELQRMSPASWGLAEVALRSGAPADAIAWCERGYAASAEVGDAAYLFPYTVTGVRAHLAGGDVTAAREWFGRCAALLRQRGIPGTLPALDHAAGLLHLADGHTGRARTALDAAGAAWAAAGRFWEGTQALTDRARCAIRSRRPDEAARLSAEAGRQARAAGATVLVPVGADREPESPLTAREGEVARLVATGATNREIGLALAIAPKTVAAHIEHILSKLGMARRSEVAAWAARQPSG